MQHARDLGGASWVRRDGGFCTLVRMSSGFLVKHKWLLNWAPAALAVAMIACESTATMSANDTSRWLLPLWKFFFGPITPAHWGVVHFFLRKIGHFLGYGIVSLAFFYGWKSTLRVRGSLRSLWLRASYWAVLCSFLVASADEFHQHFIPGRTGSPHDVALDMCGAVAAQLLLLVWAPRSERRSRASRGAIAFFL